MNFKKDSLKIMLLVVLLLGFMQVVRLGLIAKVNDSVHLLGNAYDEAKAIQLTDAEKALFVRPKYLILSEKESGDVRNVERTMNYLKSDYDLELVSSKDINFNAYEGVILMVSRLDHVSNLAALIQYVKEGGKLLFVTNVAMTYDDTFTSYAKELGITDWGMSSLVNKVTFNHEVLLGLTGDLDLTNQEKKDLYAFEVLDTELSDECDVLMETQAGAPMIWEKPLSLGDVMVLNVGMLEDKVDRGVFVGAFSLLNKCYAYPIINSELVFIDDFPADFSGKTELIEKTYGRDTQRFIMEMWWPDMQRLIRDYHLKVTTAYIQTYNNQVEGTFAGGVNSTTKRLGEDLLKSGGEICFHGYNHQPLVYDPGVVSDLGYAAWKSKVDIIKGIRCATDSFQSEFSNYDFYTYVPPSNLLSNEAIPALKEGIPEINVISGVYYGESDDYESVGGAFIQEFGVDDTYGISLPRVSSGAFLEDSERYAILSVLTTNGVVNHFIHPDDILDNNRSHGLLWEALYKQYDHLFKTLDDDYGWLNKVTSSEGAQRVAQYDKCELFYKLEGQKMTIAYDNFQNDCSVIVVSSQPIVSGEGCDFKKIGENRYLIDMHKNIVTLEVSAS